MPISKIPHIKTKNEIKVSTYEDGSLAFVTLDEELLNKAKALYGRQNQDNLCVKIFHIPAYEPFYWGKCFAFEELNRTRSNLQESTKIQNIFADLGIAPRIYGTFTIESKTTKTRHYAQLTDYIGKPDRQSDPQRMVAIHDKIYEKINAICASRGITPPWNDRWSRTNIINGKLVDWQGSHFNPNYEAGLRERYLELTKFGESNYQTIPELDEDNAIRKTEVRYKDLGLDSFDLEGKTVIDIGCSGGAFLNYATEKGAIRAVGVDWERVVNGASELSHYLGNHNIDYFASHLLKDLPKEVTNLAPFDFVIFTSMITHVKVPEYLHTLGRVMILEINHPYQVEETLEALKPHWDVKYIGQASDHGDRAIYHCFSKKLKL